MASVLPNDAPRWYRPKAAATASVRPDPAPHPERRARTSAYLAAEMVLAVALRRELMLVPSRLAPATMATPTSAMMSAYSAAEAPTVLFFRFWRSLVIINSLCCSAEAAFGALRPGRLQTLGARPTLN